MIAPNGVTVAGQRVPPEWARDVRRLFAAPVAAEPAPSQKRPALRLLEPNPGDAAVFSPPDHLRWSPLRDVGRYLLTLEALTDPVEQTWHPVQDLFLVEVTGTEFTLPSTIQWAPGALYRWRVQTGDGQTTAAGRFRILSEAQQNNLLAARRTLGKSRLLRSAIYRSYGLYDAALTELQALRALHPDQPALHRAMLNVEANIRHQRAVAAE
jgi:hypothetical protein